MAHPAWVERHWVKCVFSGMSTVSMLAPPESSSRNLTVPSELTSLVETWGKSITEASARRARSSLDRLVISRGEAAPFCQSHCQTWRALKGGSPRPTTKSSN